MQNDKQYVRDKEGYIVHPEDWDTRLAQMLAEEEDLELSENHWSVLSFMRDYWQEHKVAPDVRHVTKHLSTARGVDKKEAKQQLFSMFPYGYVKQACKIAGMQRPRAWSTG